MVNDMFDFEYYKNRIIKLSEGTVDYVALGVLANNTFYVVMLTLLCSDIIRAFVSVRYGMNVGFFVMGFILMFVAFIYNSFRMGIGAAENFVLVYFVPFTTKVRKVYKVDFNKVKYLDCKKKINYLKVKMSFTGEDGKMVNTTFKFILKKRGHKYVEMNKHAEKVEEFLLGLQKVLDKGDF